MFFLRPSGVKFYSRGDPASFDFGQGDLSTDGNWHTLDLSAIIPIGKPVVRLFVQLNDDTLGTSVKFRSTNIVNNINMTHLNVRIVNQDLNYRVMIQADADGKISYWTSAIAFSKLNIAVCGWFV